MRSILFITLTQMEYPYFNPNFWSR